MELPHCLSDHPRITAHTDGGQVDGLFYLNGPIDYAATAATPQMEDSERYSAWAAGTLVGEAEIIFEMERVAALAAEEGDRSDLLTLVGPLCNDTQDRFDEKAQAWFATGEGDVAVGQGQVPRGDLQDMWLRALRSGVRYCESSFDKQRDSTAE